jgi:hypothetical protein
MLKSLELKNTKYKSNIDTLKITIKELEEKNNKLKQNEKNLNKTIFQKEKEIKSLEIKLLNKASDLNQSTSNRSYSNYINCNNMNNSNLSNSIRLNSGIKEEKYTRINLIKKGMLSKEKLKLQEKLDEYRKFIDKKMKDITRNKNLCRTNRNKSFSKSKENFSLEKNNKNNISALIYKNSDLNNKINVNVTNKINKEEKKIKTPIKKIFICNRTQNLSDIFKKTKNKIIRSNKSKENSFINDKSNISNPNKDYFGTQDSSKNDSNLKNNSFTQINFRQFIFSNKNNKKN